MTETKRRYLNSEGIPWEQGKVLTIPHYTRQTIDGSFVLVKAGEHVSTAEVSAWSLEHLQSEGHPYPYRTGGPFQCSKFKRIAPWSTYYAGTYLQGVPQVKGAIRFNMYNSSKFKTLTGLGLTINGMTGSLDQTSLPPTPTNLTALGVSAYSRFAPGKPIANYGQSLIEIHELPRMFKEVHSLIKAMRRLPRRAYDDFLARKDPHDYLASSFIGFNFGWVPFLNDLASLFTIRDRYHKAAHQLRRDNGKGVRRRGVISTNRDSRSSSISYTSNDFVFAASDTSGYPTTGRRQTQLTEERWYSARYRYWIPDLGQNRLPLRSVLKLLGTYPSAGLLYDVLPWSWLLDWVANVGDNLHNFSGTAAENLVSDYAFVMAHDTLTVEFSGSRYINSSSGNYPPLATNVLGTWTLDSKVRASAGPFGFALSTEDFTPHQWAILATLGFSRLKKAFEQAL
jgi:hypothetical protein